MKKNTVRTAILLAAAVLLAFAGVAAADSGEWTGEVLDLKCYEKGNQGEAHASCAVRCLEGGSPMGLLVDGEVVYVDLEASDAEAVDTLKSLGGQMAMVAGDASTEGDETTITVTKAAKAEK